MSQFTTARLLDALQALRPLPAGSSLCVALSGGLDSVVLLHALTQLKELQQWRVRALHIDHQLQAISAEWSQQCKTWARQLDIECRIVRVQVEGVDELGIEAAARNARYAALRGELTEDELLLTAHHADDQLETVMLALMRGAGIDGLAAMPACTRFGLGWHLRPLLPFTRAELANWAQAHRLPVVDDPTNADSRFDRNFLRQQIIPLLKTRWPAVAHTATRSASHVATAQSMLADFIAQDFERARLGDCLRVEVLRTLELPRRYALLRYWLQQYQVLMPSTRVLQTLDHDVLHAAEDRVPCTEWGGVAVYRYRELLYLERNVEHDMSLELSWCWRDKLSLPHVHGELSVVATDTHSSLRISVRHLPETLTVRFRVGGERIRLPGERHHRELKKLLQESVLPWWRERVPLIYAAETLIAVGDLWISADCAATRDDAGVQIVWSSRPAIFAHPV